MNALRSTSAESPRSRRATESRVLRSPSPSLLSSSPMSQCNEHEGPEPIGRAGRSTPHGSLHPSLDTSARPLAVLKVTNKRGKGIFNEHEERALVRLCTGVESLLRSKAAEVSLLWSGMTERTLIRKSNNRGGAGGAWSNHAQVESTIMRLYSEASFPADAVALRRQLSKRSAAADRRQRARSDNTNNMYVDLAKKKSDGSQERQTHGSGGAKPALDDDVSRVHRVLTGESELVDLGMSLFELSSEQLLSLVARFFRNMELTDMFQVSFCWVVFVGSGPCWSASPFRVASCLARLRERWVTFAPVLFLLRFIAAHVRGVAHYPAILDQRPGGVLRCRPWHVLVVLGMCRAKASTPCASAL